MNTSVKKLDNGQVALTIEVPVGETEPFVRRAATRLAEKAHVPGFRPGKAPEHLLKSRFGEMAIYEEALQDILTQTFWQALKDNQIASIGKPEIAVEKFAPGNPLIYTATIAVMPQVTIGDWHKVSVSAHPVTVTDVDVDKLIDEVREMQATEVLVTRPATQGDKVEAHFEVRQNGVVIEGGNAKKFPMVLGKGAVIPGFEEQVIGLSAGEKKEFKLTFPKPYFQENLAGKEADFNVEVVGVYERTLPEKNDEWSQRTLQKSYEELRTTVRENLEQEQQMKEDRRLEQEVIEQIIKGALFSAIPQLMITTEVQKMMYEMEDDIKKRGMAWADYLQSIKKTKEQLAEEFKVHAEERVKGALILRTLADELNIAVTDEEINKEIAEQRERYAESEVAQANLNTKEYRQYLAITLANRKVMDHLLKQLVVRK